MACERKQKTALAVGLARRRLESDSNYLQQVRLRAGLTRAEIAELLGVTVSAVSRWETGQRIPRAKTLRRLAKLIEGLERREE